MATNSLVIFGKTLLPLKDNFNHVFLIRARTDSSPGADIMAIIRYVLGDDSEPSTAKNNILLFIALARYSAKSSFIRNQHLQNTTELSPQHS